MRRILGGAFLLGALPFLCGFVVGGVKYGFASVLLIALMVWSLDEATNPRSRS